MYLEKIEIQGFKSFANKTVLEFAKPGSNSVLVQKDGTETMPGIACIVGPNGSGKSNIVDAIRWVLGEQSLKSLRGKKSQDVIFSGSDKRARLGMAEVALFLNNEDGKMPIDYKEVVIARKLYRNGESEYKINKGKARLQDVVMLLAKSNFGQKSYSIVSQGSIDQVIMSTPAERKEYFDEAVGVKQFQLKRDQSINKLENAWNNLRQVDALLTEITPRLSSLTRQVKRLEKREQVETELNEISKTYYGSQWQELKAKEQDVVPMLKAAEKKAADKQAELREAQEHLNSLEKQESRGSAFNELQKKYQHILDNKNKLREEKLMLQNKVDMTRQREIEMPVPMTLPEILQRLDEIAAFEMRLQSGLDETSAGKLAQAKEDVKELGRLIKDLIEQLKNPKAKERQRLEVDPAWLSDLEQIEKELNLLEADLQNARQAIDDFNAQEEKKRGKFFDLQRNITAKQDEYNKLAGEVSQHRVEVVRIETHQQDLRQEIIQELGDTAWLKDYQAGGVNVAEVRENMLRLRRQLELIGGVDPEVVEEYKTTKERFDFLSEQAEDLRSSINSLEKVINDLDDKIQIQFDTTFKNINKEFSRFFKILFDGGKAELVLQTEDVAKQEEQVANEIENEGENLGILKALQDVEDKLSPKKFLKKRTGKIISGIDITATPPGKKVASITALSGGERSLASIALICAVIANNPSPFVVLDEVDAALDEANSQRFAKIISELGHKTQFIVITHNRATMHQANILYGVTVNDEGVSHLVSLKFEEAAKIVRQ